MIMMMGMCEGDSIEHRCVGNWLSVSCSHWKFVVCRSSRMIRAIGG